MRVAAVMRMAAAAALLACGRPAPIGPDPVVHRASPPEEPTLTAHQLTCVLAAFTCAERSRETLSHEQIGQRCDIVTSSVDVIGDAIDLWVNQLYSERCALGVLGARP